MVSARPLRRCRRRGMNQASRNSHPQQDAEVDVAVVVVGGADGAGDERRSAAISVAVNDDANEIEQGIVHRYMTAPRCMRIRSTSRPMNRRRF